MAAIYVFALTAAFNPRLLAAITAMLQLPSPRRLLFWYLVGAMTTSIAIGVVVVLVLGGSHTQVDVTDHIFNPVLNILIGVLLLWGAWVVVRGRNQRLLDYLERRRLKQGDKPEPRWQLILAQASAGTAFVLGAVLTLPGASYLAGLSLIARKEWPAAESVVAIVVFDVIMLALLELALVGSLFAPGHTTKVVEWFNERVRRHGARVALIIAVGLGAGLVLSGVWQLAD